MSDTEVFGVTAVTSHNDIYFMSVQAVGQQ